MLYPLLIQKKRIPKKILYKTLLKYLDEEDKKLVSEVFYYVLKKYRNKNFYRDNGYPAEFHPVQVSAILDFDAHLMIVALLHDILEDIPDNEIERKRLSKEIYDLFGEKVYNSVLELTKKSNNYENYVLNIKSKDALIVKEADILVNVMTCFAKKTSYLKFKQPIKMKINLDRFAKEKINNKTLYDHAFNKYHAKIIEEYFRVYEVEIKSLKELNKTHRDDILYLEKLLANIYNDYSKIRKKIYKNFVDGLINDKNHVLKHIKIELMKRTKEALSSFIPLNSLLISIDQNLYLYGKTRSFLPIHSKELLDAIKQQIKMADMEINSLFFYHNMLQQNKHFLKDSHKAEITFSNKKIDSLRKATKILRNFDNLVKNYS